MHARGILGHRVEPVSVDGKQLVRAGRPWRFVLANAYFLQDEAGQGAPAHVTETLDAARALGIEVVRAWAFNDRPDKASKIQDPLGVLHEPGLRALDFVVAEAARRDLKLILALGDYWPSYGGVAQWLRWRGEDIDGTLDPLLYAGRYYADPLLRAAYRDWVTALLTRRNSLTGVIYGEDATVLAWELMNEARGAPDDWISFAASCVRKHARQLIALGDESARDAPELDLLSLHCYPEKQGCPPGGEGDFGCERILEAAARAQKPLVVSEFGLTHWGLEASARAAIFRRWFACAEAARVTGIGPWLLTYRNRPRDWDEGYGFHHGGEYDDVIREAIAHRHDEYYCET